MLKLNSERERSAAEYLVQFPTILSRRSQTSLLAFSITLAYAASQEFDSISKCSSQTCEHSVLWKNIPTTEIAAIKVAVFPVGSIEGHGPHLPLGTDLLLAEAITMNATTGLPGIAVLPASPFGASFEHSTFPGTIPVQDSHLNGLWDDVLLGITQSGVSKIVVVNAHGGQTSNVDLAVRKRRFQDNKLVVSFNIQAMMAQAWGSIAEEANFSGEESVYGIHGGLIETSVMLHIFPSLVKLSKMEKFAPRWDVNAENLRPHDSVVAYGWQSEDLSEFGAVGDATQATAEIGCAIFERTTTKLRALLTDLLHKNVERILNVPS